jgi:hypothetical protein
MSGIWIDRSLVFAGCADAHRGDALARPSHGVETCPFWTASREGARQVLRDGPLRRHSLFVCVRVWNPAERRTHLGDGAVEVLVRVELHELLHLDADLLGQHVQRLDGGIGIERLEVLREEGCDVRPRSKG